MRTQLTIAAAAGLTAVAVALSGAVAAITPAASGQNCAPGFVRNPYNSQCLAPVVTPVINGIPCIPSNLGLCQSFVQNQQPQRRP